MTKFDPNDFLNRPIYAFDFQAMIGDVLDFLEFSEHNIELQHHAERQSIHRQSRIEDFPNGYLEHLCTNADHRFTVSLPMRLRYASLIALCTTVEWQANHLAERANFIKKDANGKIKKSQNKNTAKNTTVYILEGFDQKLSLGKRREIEDFERLVVVRNAVVHSAGVERDDPHKSDLKASVKVLNGFSLSAWHFFGECVTIDKGALPPYIEAMAQMLPAMFEQADKQGLLT